MNVFKALDAAPRTSCGGSLTMLTFWSVFIGAGLGACFRWWLGLRLNAVLPALPLGTLASNLIGGYIIGVAVAIFTLKSQLPAEARLFVITGFLGGLTTFSTFSAEVVSLLAQARYGWALAEICAHLLGSLAATALGMFMVYRMMGSASGH